MLHMLEALCPCVVVVENAQHLSDREWFFAQRLLDRLGGRPGFALLVTGIPLHSPKFRPRWRAVPEAYGACLHHSSTLHVSLGPIPNTALETVLRQRWPGCTSVDPKLAALVTAKCGGSPSFCTRLADKLWSLKLVQADAQGVVRLSSALDDNSKDADADELDVPLPLPYAAQRALTAMMDQLNFSQQLTLKVLI
jgi:hypothetical protein